MRSFFKKILCCFVPRICWLYIHIVAITSRIRFVGYATCKGLKEANKPFIYAFWHGRQFFLPYLVRGENVRVLISKSQDGEMIARAITLFGIEAIRGSSSRGGANALEQMFKALQSNMPVGITPDGPRGPACEVQMGVLQLAQKMGVPIIPLSFDARYKKKMGSWDSFLFPFPCNDIVLTFGNPVFVSKSDSLTDAAQTLKKALDENTHCGTLILLKTSRHTFLDAS
jgi:lysophospholipid acyltransferase (LPLAT)-like uncharacterized protein